MTWFEPGSWTLFATALAIGVVAAVLLVALVTIPFRLLARRSAWDPAILGRVRRPFRVLVLVVAVWIVVTVAFPEDLVDWRDTVYHVLRILLIAGSGWLLAALVGFVVNRLLSRYRIDVADNRVARRVHTQANILRRLVAVVIAIITVGAILLTFPGVEAVGASLLASAGLVSVVAGLAAQSTLSNVFAGLQLAFSDAIRVDDVVVVEGQWGRIEEITLTYVAVHLWDDRRLVLPSTYFTATPFENWTRRGSELIGAVELDVDWGVSPGELRAELERVLDGDPLWDRRTSVLQVTDAVGGLVRVRILVSAGNAGALWDLRCNVREALVEFIHDREDGALPRQRVQLVEPPAARDRAPREEHEGLFSGSVEGERRQASLTQSVPIQQPERDER